MWIVRYLQWPLANGHVSRYWAPQGIIATGLIRPQKNEIKSKLRYVNGAHDVKINVEIKL